MQQLMFTIPIPPLLAIGFLTGIILFVLGYREHTDTSRRHHLMGSGLIVIGIMIPLSPISWYLYWILTSILILGLIDFVIIGFTLVAGIALIYRGFTIYVKFQ
ncbi:MAG: hypothetical protein ACFFEW_17645 [Candidatus Thorarchaeota archaeon]